MIRIGLQPVFGRLLPVALLVSRLAGCGGDMTDLEKFVVEARSAGKSPIEPLPVIQPHATYRYDSTGLRDPFEPILFGGGPAPRSDTTEPARVAGGPQPDFNRPREALEAFPLDSLRMVGVLERQGRRWALIKAPDGTIHRVTTGNHMGQNHGRIVKITESRVELIELAPTGLGGWTERSASLALSQ